MIKRILDLLLGMLPCIIQNIFNVGQHSVLHFTCFEGDISGVFLMQNHFIHYFLASSYNHLLRGSDTGVLFTDTIFISCSFHIVPCPNVAMLWLQPSTHLPGNTLTSLSCQPP